MTNPTAPAPAARQLPFFPLVAESGYWVGVANHACADPEYVHIPAHIAGEATSPGFCPGFDNADRGTFDALCRCCESADDDLPF